MDEKPAATCQHINFSTSTAPVVANSLIINGGSNYNISDRCNRFTKESGVHTLEKLVVWGGAMGNCAGDSFSKLLLAQHNSLSTIVFFPERAKRALIQPHYIHRRTDIGEGAQEVFPCLTTLAVSEFAARRPLNYGYRTPNLRELIVLISRPPDRALTLADLRKIPLLQRWCDVSSPRSHARALHADCPALQHIHVVPASTNDDALTAFASTCTNVLCTLTAPAPLSWSRSRLVLIGTRETSSWFGKISMGGDVGVLVKNVFSFLHQPHWRISVGSSGV